MAAKVDQSFMSFKIEYGLFKFDFTDHHAVLGVSVEADFNEIRQRYLKIARSLHPDSCNATGVAAKQRASQMLSKLVNPAYEKFSKERSRAEYMILLREFGKRLVQESTPLELKYELSKQLNQTNNIDYVYRTSLSQLAQKQYESLDQVLEITAQLSELNLVYLLRQGGKISLPVQQVADSKTTPSEKSKDTPATQPAAQPQPESLAEPYLRRAQILIEKNQFAQARVELQDAIKLEPNNSHCHSLMAAVYLKQNQTTMAKVHINKALQLDPQDQLALKGKQVLDQLLPQNSNQPAASKTKQSKGGGLFGGLFGGKKK